MSAKFKVTKKTSKQIEIMQRALSKLNEMGYILDFVEGIHCICHVKRLKKEMEKPFRDIDTDNYVADSLKN